MILDEPWPGNLDPADVPFRARSATVLRRMGFFDDPTHFNTLTDDKVLSWTNAEPVTVADIRDTGNEAIRCHHGKAAFLGRIEAGLAAVAEEPWAPYVWYRDPRFRAYLPKGDATVYNIATFGTVADRRFLWDNREALRKAVDTQAALPLPEAIAQYVGAITGWHGEKLEVVLAVTGLNGQDPITKTEGARQLGVSHQAVSQAVQRLWRRRDWARLPAGAWLPQVDEAERGGWLGAFVGVRHQALS